MKNSFGINFLIDSIRTFEVMSSTLIIDYLAVLTQGIHGDLSVKALLEPSMSFRTENKFIL